MAPAFFDLRKGNGGNAKQIAFHRRTDRARRIECDRTAGQSGHDLQPGIDGSADLRITKAVNSAFYGTPDLKAWLDQHNYTAVTICGIMTNFCCETTARMAGNLGYDVDFVLDATRTFDHQGIDGSTIPADTMYAVTAANLNGEFATVVSTAGVLAR